VVTADSACFGLPGSERPTGLLPAAAPRTNTSPDAGAGTGTSSMTTTPGPPNLWIRGFHDVLELEEASLSEPILSITKTAHAAHSESGKGDAAITSTVLGVLYPGMKRSQMLAFTVPYVVPGLFAKPAK
jgi:hypothetical protein